MWIKCSERMPEPNVWVIISNLGLACVDFGIYRDGDYLEDDERWQNEAGEFIELCSGYPVTHWMPLPEPPED